MMRPTSVSTPVPGTTGVTPVPLRAPRSRTDAKLETVKLSVVIPVYNERRWIKEIVYRVRAVPVPKEIIIVDDGSTDGTREALAELDEADVRVIFLPANRGKGAALREAFRHVSGDTVIVQDADLEYDPRDYARLIRPILEDRADVVYGSRFLPPPGPPPNRGRVGRGFRQWQRRDAGGTRHWHALANRCLTAFSNAFTNLNLTDMETCYKVFRRDVLDGIRLKSNRFGFEPEITAKIAKKTDPPWRVCEVPIRYSPRTYAEGKKIRFKDALSTLGCILWYWLFD